FIDEIRNSVSIPVLSILEETSSFLKKQKVKSVGILATSTLLKSGIYERTLKKQMIAQVKPDNYEQEKIGKVISNIVLNRHANKDREQLLKIIENLEKKKVRHVILACTDLQLLIPKNSKIKIYDTMKIFAEATVNKILE
ncbi:MAG: amino acid racemase, partial [Nanoarchaeota archaeon]